MSMERRNYTFRALMEEGKRSVRIPIFQRDYAHGRQDSHASDVRGDLLDDLAKAVLDEASRPLNLNFVYGKTVEDPARKDNTYFMPVDGQQRLTTLFLVHIYALSAEPQYTDLLKSFSYETRESSRDFFASMVEHRGSIDWKEPDENVPDQSWFLFSWQHDPTVSSALIMLRAIAEKFPDTDGPGANKEKLKNALLDEQNPPVTFKFLDINSLAKEDSLYVKLNARGLDLTSLELLKAGIIQRIKALQKQNPALAANIPGDFEMHFDGAWTDYFWASREQTANAEENWQSFDHLFYHFFLLILSCKTPQLSPENEEKPRFSAMDDAEFRAFIDKIYYTLNYLSALHQTHPLDTSRGDRNNPLVIVKDALEKQGGTIGTYTSRTLFYALVLYLWEHHGQDDGTLKNWLRIAGNLIRNTLVERPSDYYLDEKGRLSGIISDIDALVRTLRENAAPGSVWADPLTFFAGLDPDGFDKKKYSRLNPSQIKEEIIKARIIRKDPAFEAELMRAESEPAYFDGQVRCALYRSGANGVYDREAFTSYWNIVRQLFQANGPYAGSLLRQALLTYGDYRMPVQEGKYLTFCPDSRSELQSMKALFSLSEDDVIQAKTNADNAGSQAAAEKNRAAKATKAAWEAVSGLLSDLRQKKSLKDIAAGGKTTIPQDDWRHLMLRYDKLFFYSPASFLRTVDIDGIPHFMGKKSNGINRNIFLSALYEELLARKGADVFDNQLIPDRHRGVGDDKAIRYLTLCRPDPDAPAYRRVACVRNSDNILEFICQETADIDKDEDKWDPAAPACVLSASSSGSVPMVETAAAKLLDWLTA